MPNKTFKQIWFAPILLALLTVFGLLSALLGNGFWYSLSWSALLIPLVVIVWFWIRSKTAVKEH